VTPDTLLAAVAGAGIAAGTVCAACGVLGYPPPGQRPPPRWMGTLQRWRITPRTAAIALAAGMAIFAVTGWPVAGIAGIPAAVALPRILSRRPGRAQLATLEALQAWTRRLADVIAASRGLEDALILSADSAPAAISGPARTLAAQLRHRGTRTADALQKFAAEIDDPVGDLIAAALMLAADLRGPGLHAVLTELAADVAKDISGRREVEAERARYRTALAWIVVFLAGYLVFLVANRSYSAPYATSAGQLVLAAVAACWAAGLYWLWRLAQMTGPRRFLTAPVNAGGERPSP
jgi:hypothetical protein